MAGTVALAGKVTSWGGTFNTNLIGLMQPAAFTLEMSNAELDTTPFLTQAPAQSVVETAVPGLRAWEGTIEGYSGDTTGRAGIAGTVATAVYDYNVRSWDISLTATDQDTTSWPNTTSWMTYAPGLMRWSGNYEAIIDDTNAVTVPETSAGTGTFTLSSGNYWEGQIFSTRVSAVVRVGDVNIVRYAFRGSGHLTVVGSDAGMTANSGALATPEAGSLVLQAHTSRTYTGSAFWRSIAMNCAVGGVIQTTIGFRGTGALTPA
jgi:hypothetical protein